MRSAIIGFVSGAACLQALAVLPDPAQVALIGLAALLLACCPLPGSSAGGPGAATVLAGAARAARAAIAGGLFGFAWATILAHASLAPRLDAADEGRDFTIVGTIDSLPYVFDDGVRFNFKVEQVLGWDGPRPAALPPRLALSWYAGFAGKPQAPVGDVQPGERWRLKVRLQRPHGNANPGGFDYEAWLLEEGVRATGYVRSETAHGANDNAGNAVNARLAPFVISFNNIVERCRAVLRARILATLTRKPYAGVVVALVVGDQRAIDQDDWLVFSRTGVSHLISISGLHITMVAGMAAWLAAGLWRRSFFTRARLPLLLPAQKVAAATGALTALLYVLLAGFGVPAQRTLYMLTVIALALWCGRLHSVSQLLCAALGVVVLLDPWAVLAPGFWLSFGAVGLILYAGTGRTAARPGRPRAAPGVAGVQSPRPHWRLRIARAAGPPLRAALATQYVVTLGLVPLTLLLFAQISLVSPLANAVAIPVISFVVTPLALLGSVLPAPLMDVLLLSAHQVLAWLAALLAWLAAAPLAVWAAPTPSPLTFAFAMLGMVWLLAPRGWPLRWTGLIACLPALAARADAPPEGQFTATVFDVGQGMAMLVETAHHRLLYDTGPRYSLDSNGGNRTITPYLKSRGIGGLDAVVISHSDADHAGGALAVLGTVPVKLVLSSLDARHPIVRKAAHSAHCIAGQAWDWDGVHFAVLHPTAASYDDAALKTNARSCVLRITARGGDKGAALAGVRTGATLLAAGDVESSQEAQLLARRPALDKDTADGDGDGDGDHGRLRVSPAGGVRAASIDGSLAADVLLAPHHGSGTSSTPAFLAAVQPSLAIFQVGYRNRYHHPKPAVWQRYADAGIARWRTDETGAITLRFGSGVSVERYRVSHARYWYGR